MDWIRECTGFGWGRVNFLPSGWYGAVFWICVEHRVDNTEMFLLLLSTAYREPRPLLLLIWPRWRGDWDAGEGRKRHSQ